MIYRNPKKFTKKIIYESVDLPSRGIPISTKNIYLLAHKQYEALSHHHHKQQFTTYTTMVYACLDSLSTERYHYWHDTYCTNYHLSTPLCRWHIYSHIYFQPFTSLMKYITGLGQMLIDIPLYIIKPTDTSNKLNQLLTFLFKEYPAYLRE
jgi:hypothetical protein